MTKLQEIFGDARYCASLWDGQNSKYFGQRIGDMSAEDLCVIIAELCREKRSLSERYIADMEFMATIRKASR